MEIYQRLLLLKENQTSASVTVAVVQQPAVVFKPAPVRVLTICNDEDPELGATIERPDAPAPIQSAPMSNTERLAQRIFNINWFLMLPFTRKNPHIGQTSGATALSKWLSFGAGKSYLESFTELEKEMRAALEADQFITLEDYRAAILSRFDNHHQLICLLNKSQANEQGIQSLYHFFKNNILIIEQIAAKYQANYCAQFFARLDGSSNRSRESNCQQQNKVSSSLTK